MLESRGVKSYRDLFTWASKTPCRHVFFVRLRCLDDLEKFMSTWSEFPWNYQGETSFSIEESTNSRLRKLFMSSQWPLFFFSQFLVVWRLCLYLWVPYNLGHAFPTLFTVAALLFWCFLSRLVLEANERRKVLDGGFLGGFFTFQGCAYIYGFLITWGTPF